MPSMVVCSGFEVADVARGGVSSSTSSVLTSRLTMKTSNANGLGSQTQPAPSSATTVSGKGLGGLSREMAKQSKGSSSVVLNQTPSKSKRVGKSSLGGGDDEVRGGASPPNAPLGSSLSSSLYMSRYTGQSEPMRSMAMAERFGHTTLKPRSRAEDTFGVGSAPVCSSFDRMWSSKFRDLQMEVVTKEDSNLDEASVFEGEDYEKNSTPESLSFHDVEEVSEREAADDNEEEEEEQEEVVQKPLTVTERTWVSIKDKYPVLRISSVEKAYSLWQKTYYKSDLDTSLILCEMGMDANTIAAALVKESFKMDPTRSIDLGDVITSIISQVHDVEKLSTFARRLTRKEISAEARAQLQKAFLSVSDVRALIIALAKRLVVLRNLKKLLASQQKKLAEETLAFYVPLANRLGLWAFKAEMEEMCFATLDPAMYNHLKRAAGAKEDENRECLAVAIQELEKTMKNNNIGVLSLSGRPKTLYSMFEKMRLKKKREDEILDKRGIRILVEKEYDCYRALDAVHSVWKPLEDSVKDYIAKPKENGYKSIHTVVRGPSGLPIEIQIRTSKMHLVAEHGIAAHWRYKESGEQNGTLSDIDRHIKLARDSLHDIIRKCGQRKNRSNDGSSEIIAVPRKLERSGRREALMN